MKMRKMQLLGLVGFFLFSVLLFAQVQNVSQKKPTSNKQSLQDVSKAESSAKKEEQKEQSAVKDIPKDKKESNSDSLLIPIVTLIVGIIFGAVGLESFKWFIGKIKKRRVVRTKKDKYQNALKEELGTIDMLGSPDIESKTVKLEDAFVSLCISESWRSEERFKPEREMEEFYGRHLTPEQVMTRAFKKHRLLLVIGDPGSGKTTLMKYYAISFLNKKYRQFGFTEDVFPIYFPLRELDFENNEPVSLLQNLAKWSDRHLLNIPADQFNDWLHNRKTLVLLDGLDEISSKEHRRKVCRWVKDMCNGLKNAFFVVTSRATGYRKLDGIELKMPHLRADIMDFSPEQQEMFLKKWSRAVFLGGLPPEGMSEQEWKEKQFKLADQRSQPIIDFLKKEENKALQELAAVPMLLQIMAIIWKERKYLPKSRPALFNAALNYLLAHRDEEKDIDPLLPADESRRVLAPTALWMQEELQKDEAPKETMHKVMQPILDTLEQQLAALTFCNYLRDRAGLIADYDRDHYIFRHKSFREFLAGIQLKEESHEEKRIETLVEHFKDDWWEETLRFFISKSNDKVFDRFMRAFFKSKVSQELNAHQQNLLQNLVKDAPQKRIDALRKCINSEQLNNNQIRYVMDCLKTIGTEDAVKAVEAFIERSSEDEANLGHATDIVAELTAAEAEIVEEIRGEYVGTIFLGASRNHFEDNVEYIKIPSGTYQYSVSKQKITVPDLYFCKYPVTNKRYRRFISFLAGKERVLLQKLPLDMYAEKLLKFSESIKKYKEYLGKDPGKWQDLLRSRYDDDKRFKGEDQPVVGVTWYAARAYCFWLSCLETVINQGRKIEDVKQVAELYRLPTEEEWEWAAGGEPDGSTREYPWTKDKGKPNKNLANYGEHVGATTPVGRYPEGTTPQGLMDMAGNVWEWMKNYYDEDKEWLALRGGSWRSNDWSLVCSSRNADLPVLNWYNIEGFRVVRASPPVK